VEDANTQEVEVGASEHLACGNSSSTHALIEKGVDGAVARSGALGDAVTSAHSARDIRDPARPPSASPTSASNIRSDGVRR
jgi:hypothetical protein